MIKPVSFGYNAETAVNNAFQVKSDETGIQEKALKEFNDFVALFWNVMEWMSPLLKTPFRHILRIPFSQTTGYRFIMMVPYYFIPCMR